MEWMQGAVMGWVQGAVMGMDVGGGDDSCDTYCRYVCTYLLVSIRLRSTDIPLTITMSECSGVSNMFFSKRSTVSVSSKRAMMGEGRAIWCHSRPIRTMSPNS